jgi:hypothetical protein
MSEKRNIFNGIGLLVSAILVFAVFNYLNYSDKEDFQIALFPFEVFKTVNGESVFDGFNLFFNACIPIFIWAGFNNWLDSNRWIEDKFFNRLEKSSFAKFIRDFRKFRKDRKSK